MERSLSSMSWFHKRRSSQFMNNILPARTSSASSQLCEECQTAFEGRSKAFHPDPTRRYYILRRGYSSFHQAVQDNSCRLCYELWSVFESSTRLQAIELAGCDPLILFTTFARTNPDGVTVIRWQFDIYVNVSFWCRTPDKITRNSFVTALTSAPPRYQLMTDWFQFVFLHAFDLVLAEAPRDKRTSKDIGSASNSFLSLALAERWLKDCIKNHPGCKPARHGNASAGSSSISISNTSISRNDKRCMPTRLVDVGKKGDPKVHLRVVDTLILHQDYITLSHRWGANEPLQLRKDTFDNLITGINIENLPRTFRNAVELTRQLKVRFIWIDSLCIFQDSIEDWNTEVEKMGDIYENCLLNIAASAAKGSQDNLFFARDPVLIQPLQVIMHWPLYGDHRHELNVQQTQPQLYDCIPHTMWHDCVDGATLNTRSWVMQERMLSPRVLHCARRQFFWECSSKRACEMFPHSLYAPTEAGSPVRLVRMLDRMRKDGYRRSFTTGGVVTSSPSVNMAIVGEAYCAWKQLVKDYSRSRAKRDSDMLAAISGLARKFETRLGETYLAGLLEGDLCRQLLWHTTDPAATRLGAWHNKPLWRAPSWSWASIKGDIDWDLDFLPITQSNFTSHDEPLFELVRQQITPQHASNRTGQLSSAWLMVRGTPFFLQGNLSRVPDLEFRQLWGPRSRILWLKIGEQHHRAVAQFDEEATLKLLANQRGGNRDNLVVLSMAILASTKQSTVSSRSKNRDSAVSQETQSFEVRGLLLHRFGDDPGLETGMTRIGRFIIESETIEVINYFVALGLDASNECLLV